MKGVKLIGKKSIFIDKSVKIGKNVVIYQNNVIEGNTEIGDNCVLLPNNIIRNAKIGNGTTIESSHIVDSVIGNCVSVGPFSRLRPNTVVGDNCKVGNFVELKNAKLGNGTKASHLAYVGDAEVGKNCNIGCGAIFVNYNGKEKFRSVIGDNCFIGSNVNVVAPVTMADGTYVCAGTTITSNTEKNDFVIGRVRETIKPNRATKYQKETKGE